MSEKIMPGQPCPELNLPLVGGGRFSLAENPQDQHRLVVFYRGQHCPKCKQQLNEIQDRLEDIVNRRVEVVAISMNDEDTAQGVRDDWGIHRVPVCHSLDRDTALAWNLYISSAIKDAEPAEFCEPGLFLVNPDGTLYAAWIQTVPFARPQLDDLLGAIDFIRDNDYPARGQAA